MEKFPCNACGVCCKNISGIEELKDFDSGSGICKFLDTSSNQCRIYENRPEICRVDVMYEKQYSHLYSIEKFYELNLQACEVLQNEKMKNKIK